jgi:hypothetical protein
LTVDPLHTVSFGTNVYPTIGKGFTVIFAVAVFVHPAALVPVTVYVEDANGKKIFPSITPPVHEYELAPVPFNVSESPAQRTVPGVAT